MAPTVDRRGRRGAGGRILGAEDVAGIRPRAQGKGREALIAPSFWPGALIPGREILSADLRHRGAGEEQRHERDGGRAALVMAGSGDPHSLAS